MKGSSSSIVYFSLDMERSGDWPDKHFVTEIGLVAFSETGQELSCKQLYLAQEKGKDPETREWYAKQPGYETWKQEARSAEVCMYEIKVWMKHVKRKAKAQKHAFICAPTSADGKWFSILWFRYIGHPQGGPKFGPGHTYIDIRSFGAGKLGVDVFEAKKNKALAPYRPSEEECPHTHLAVDDAREQGVLFFNILNDKKTDLKRKPRQSSVESSINK